MNIINGIRITDSADVLLEYFRMKQEFPTKNRVYHNEIEISGTVTDLFYFYKKRNRTRSC